MAIKVKMPTDSELNKMFGAVPALEKHRVADKAMRAGAKPVVKRAKAIARSRHNGQKSRQGWSRKMFRSRNDGGQARTLNEKPIWKSIATKVVKFEKGAAVAIVGPKYPEASQVNFFGHDKGGRRAFYWGRPGRFVPFFDWLKKANDETRPEQRAAIKESLKKSMRQIWELS